MNRNPNELFHSGQKIRHIINDKKNKSKSVYEFTYNKEEKKFKFFDLSFDSMNQITTLHYRNIKPNRTDSNNAWKECETLIDDKWYSTLNLEKSITEIKNIDVYTLEDAHNEIKEIKTLLNNKFNIII